MEGGLKGNKERYNNTPTPINKIQPSKLLRCDLAWVGLRMKILQSLQRRFRFMCGVLVLFSQSSCLFSCKMDSEIWIEIFGQHDFPHGHWNILVLLKWRLQCVRVVSNQLPSVVSCLIVEYCNQGDVFW